ncbi:cytochrome b [Allosphingosinicella vermicomposti]|uniref:cytochrome b n=1 Tax=Allosphingosinicella vermicomposti TaxID=614671 RepID=UPI000D113333|nr:cytochrome b [Allosphingosinicella vermicomposti]
MIGARLREWARRHSDKGRYTPVGIIFHWVMAALVILQLALGWYTTRMYAGGDRLTAYQWHSDLGLLILFLAFLRFAWRMMVPGPINDADKGGWQTNIAYATHVVFYLCFFGLPITGWMMWSALGDGRPLYVAGLVPWPQMPFGGLDPQWQWAILDWAEDLHQMFILILIILIPLHVGAALKHHWWDRDDVLEGMLPDVKDADDHREGLTHKPKRPRSPRVTGAG